MINRSLEDHFVIEIFISKCLGKTNNNTVFRVLYHHKLDLRLFLPVGLSTSLWWKGEMKDRGKEVYPRHVAEVAYIMSLENESLIGQRKLFKGYFACYYMVFKQFYETKL